MIAEDGALPEELAYMDPVTVATVARALRAVQVPVHRNAYLRRRLAVAAGVAFAAGLVAGVALMAALGSWRGLSSKWSARAARRW